MCVRACVCFGGGEGIPYFQIRLSEQTERDFVRGPNFSWKRLSFQATFVHRWNFCQFVEAPLQ